MFTSKHIIRLKPKRVLNYSIKKFQVLSSEEYFVNMRESDKKTQIETCKLLPLPEAGIYTYITIIQVTIHEIQNADLSHYPNIKSKGIHPY